MTLAELLRAVELDPRAEIPGAQADFWYVPGEDHGVECMEGHAHASSLGYAVTNRGISSTGIRGPRHPRLRSPHRVLR